LVLRSVPNRWYWWDAEGDTAPTLELIDLADPTAPVHAASYSLPGGEEMGTLQVVDGFVVTSHREPVPGAEASARFYLDQIDVSRPTRPRRVASINIPGSPIDLDADGRLVTVDYQRIIFPGASWEDCATGGYSDAYFDYEAGMCSRLERSVNLLDVGGGVATLRDRLRLADRSLRDVRVTESRVFIGTNSTSWWWYGEESDVDPRPELIVLTGIERGRLDEGGSVRMSTPYSWLFAARGDLAFVRSDSPPALDVYGAADASAPAWEQQELLTGYGYDLQLLDDTVVSANGAWGVQVIDLAD
jgi:hypothetical protein